MSAVPAWRSAELADAAARVDWDSVRAYQDAVQAQHEAWEAANPTDEPFRWCVYCRADCDVDDVEHAQDCPTVTGLRVIEESIENRVDVPCCMRCRGEMPIGSFYALRPTTDGIPGVAEAVDVYESVCVGCMILDDGEG